MGTLRNIVEGVRDWTNAKIDGVNIPLEWSDGYPNRGGGLSSFSGNGKYVKSEPVLLKPNTTYEYYGTNNALADMSTVCLYTDIPTSSSNCIDVIVDNNSLPVTFTTPSGTVYARFGNVTTVVPTESVYLFEHAEIEKKFKSTEIVIKCTGDSVTEGMSTDGAHTAVYGKAPYPARLQTLLTDNGYNVRVYNGGHGGEKTNAILSRIGALSVITTEDIVIPTDDSDVEIYNSTAQTAKIGTICGTDIKNCYYSYMGQDCNPVYIDGRKYAFGLASDNKTGLLKKKFELSEPLTIKAGSVIHLGGAKKDADVNIILCGVNDGGGTNTFAEWTEMLKRIATVNPKYIFVSPHYKMWNYTGYGEGETDAEKQANYNQKMVGMFGEHFIDLYEDWFAHAYEYAVEDGYLTDLTAEQITSTKTMLEGHVTPSALTVNGANGNVHLNEAGYHVIARIIFDRLKVLQYI